MANDAYKVKADVSLPRAIREAGELVNGDKLYETEGRTYAAGEYVLAEDITPPLRKRAEEGELDHLLEPVSRKEALAGQEAVSPVFVPEHEAERVVLEQGGATTVPRDQVIELRAGAQFGDEAKEALEAAKEEGRDERPGLTAGEVPDLNSGENIVEKDKERVDEARLEGVEQPPGLPLAAGGDDKPAAKRARPARSKSEAKSADSEKDEK